MARGQRQREIERGPGLALPLNAFAHSLYRQDGTEFIPGVIAAVVLAGLKTRGYNRERAQPSCGGQACRATTRWWLSADRPEPASESGRYNGFR